MEIVRLTDLLVGVMSSASVHVFTEWALRGAAVCCPRD
jgi:hypothetical protein